MSEPTSPIAPAVTPSATEAPASPTKAAASLYPADTEAPAPAPVEGTPAPAAQPEATPTEEPAPDASPLGEQPEGEKSAEEAKPPEPITAASYTDFTLPESITIDPDGMSAFKDTAAKAGLSQEAAQSLIDVYSKQMEAIMATHTAMIDGWKAEIKADPVLSKTSEVQVTFGRALDQFGSPEVRQAFDLTGAGWNPHILRFIHKMASALSEGSPQLTPAPPTRKGLTAAERLYPNERPN